jgi:hypothetical protein
MQVTGVSASGKCTPTSTSPPFKLDKTPPAPVYIRDKNPDPPVCTTPTNDVYYSASAKLSSNIFRVDFSFFDISGVAALYLGAGTWPGRTELFAPIRLSESDIANGCYRNTFSGEATDLYVTMVAVDNVGQVAWYWSRGVHAIGTQPSTGTSFIVGSTFFQHSTALLSQ